MSDRPGILEVHGMVEAADLAEFTVFAYVQRAPQPAAACAAGRISSADAGSAISRHVLRIDGRAGRPVSCERNVGSAESEVSLRCVVPVDVVVPQAVHLVSSLEVVGTEPLLEVR